MVFRWDPKFACLDHDKYGMEQVNHAELWHEILRKLQDFSTMTWQAIIDATGSRRAGNNNHTLDPDRDLTEEGRSAWLKQPEDLREMPLFSLHLTSRRRIIGFRQGYIFFPIWHDSSHSFTKTSKR